MRTISARAALAVSLGLAMVQTYAMNTPLSLVSMRAIAARDALAEPEPVAVAGEAATDFESEAAAPAEHRMLRVTAYCDRGLTAAGVPSGVGQCAAPADVPFGSRIYIPALDREFVVTDRTHPRFRHNTVDLFMPARDACLEFGARYLECEIRQPAQTPRYGSRAIRHAARSAAATWLPIGAAPALIR